MFVVGSRQSGVLIAVTAMVPATRRALLLLGFAITRRFSERKNHDFFARKSADVVVQAHGFGSGDVLNHRIQFGPRYLDKLRSNLLQQVASFLSGKRRYEMLFGCSQDTPQANDQPPGKERRRWNVWNSRCIPGLRF